MLKKYDLDRRFIEKKRAQAYIRNVLRRDLGEKISPMEISKYVDLDNIGVGGIPGINVTEKLLEEYQYSTSFGMVSEADKDTVLERLSKKFTLLHSHLSFETKNFNSLYRSDTAHFAVSLNANQSWGVLVGAKTPNELESIYRLFEEMLPPLEEKEEKRINLKFWTSSPGGPTSWTRKISVEPWKEVSRNYPTEVSEPLGRLIQHQPELEGGKLLLWHGKPGTGKTHAIRSLAQTWKDWCQIEYIIDPERFFGDANYMVQCLIGGDDSNPRSGRWRLILIEDAGEYIRADASEKTGQGLSRLLNLTDGLIGQGLKIMVLMTTNERFTDLAASVARSGRCLSHLEFRPFTETEAQNWLGETPVKRQAGQTDWILADLYAQKTHQNKIQSEKKEPVRNAVYL